jgi:cell division cycle protein 20 (cofactor of APC complex)
MACGVENQANEKLLALGTSTGCVQIWDVQARKMTMTWTMKEVPAMAWNGPVLTVGTEKGVFRHFDTRIKPQVKMKELAKKVVRHRAQLTQISYNNEGKLFATADSAGTIHCWDTRDPKKPLDVGEIVQRRKKMQHFGSVSVCHQSKPLFYC